MSWLKFFSRHVKRLPSEAEHKNEIKTIAMKKKRYFPFLLEKEWESDWRNLAKVSNSYVSLKNRMLEKKLSKIILGSSYNSLDNLPKISKEIQGVCETLLKGYSNEGALFKTDCLYEAVDNPTSMFFKNTQELAYKMVFMYQFSYAHYVLAKRYGMKNGSAYSFPHLCCGRATSNVVMAFWEAGIVSAIYAYCDESDHAYIVMPFIVESPTFHGVVLVDPTSDQLTNKKSKRIRNLVEIRLGNLWDYSSDWSDGANLFPQTVTKSVSSHYPREYRLYIEKAFQNPVVVI